MVDMPDYPLQEVLIIKNRRVDAAEKVVKKRKGELEIEQKKLSECERARDKVKQHRMDKLCQIRYEMDHGTNTAKIQQMKAYITVVNEKLAEEEKKVTAQKQQVKVAEKNLEEAFEELRKKRKEVEKLDKHREEWSKEMRKEMELKEAIEQNELGSTMFLSNLRVRKRK